MELTFDAMEPRCGGFGLVVGWVAVPDWDQLGIGCKAGEMRCLDLGWPGCGVPFEWYGSRSACVRRAVQGSAVAAGLAGALVWAGSTGWTGRSAGAQLCGKSHSGGRAAFSISEVSLFL